VPRAVKPCARRRATISGRYTVLRARSPCRGLLTVPRKQARRVAKCARRTAKFTQQHKGVSAKLARRRAAHESARSVTQVTLPYVTRDWPPVPPSDKSRPRRPAAAYPPRPGAPSTPRPRTTIPPDPVHGEPLARKAVRASSDPLPLRRERVGLRRSVRARRAVASRRARHRCTRGTMSRMLQ
jgi:hypothetical protein